MLPFKKFPRTLLAGELIYYFYIFGRFLFFMTLKWLTLENKMAICFAVSVFLLTYAIR